MSGGVTRIKPPPPHYYDLYECPFDREDLTISDVNNYNWPDPQDPGRYRGVVERARELREKTDYGVMFVFNVNLGPRDPVHAGASTSGLKTSSCGLTSSRP